MDEGDDAPIGCRTREHGEDRGQQQVAHAVALSLCAAWVAHRSERGEHVASAASREADGTRATSMQVRGRFHRSCPTLLLLGCCWRSGRRAQAVMQNCMALDAPLPFVP
jgi:hypothetical protein